MAAHDTPSGTRMMCDASVKDIWTRAHRPGSTASTFIYDAASQACIPVLSSQADESAANVVSYGLDVVWNAVDSRHGGRVCSCAPPPSPCLLRVAAARPR